MSLFRDAIWIKSVTVAVLVYEMQIIVHKAYLVSLYYLFCWIDKKKSHLCGGRYTSVETKPLFCQAAKCYQGKIMQTREEKCITRGVLLNFTVVKEGFWIAGIWANTWEKCGREASWIAGKSMLPEERRPYFKIAHK